MSALIKEDRFTGSDQVGGTGGIVEGPLTQAFIQDTWVEKSGEVGVLVQDLAEARLARNVVRDGGGVGLRVATNANVVLQASRLIDNLGGVEVSSSQLDIFDTLVAILPEEKSTTPAGASMPQDGIFGEMAKVRVHNSMIFGSSGFGMRLEEAEGGVFNSILFQNESGDVSGLNPTSVRHNLIGDGQLQGEEGNITGDPLFTRSSAGDFSLDPQSPAIDRGSLEFGVSEVDLQSHRRVIGDLDLGAIEFGSEFALPRMLPIFTVEQGQFTGLAVVNHFNAPGRLLLRAYSREGQLWGTFERQMVAKTQFAILLREAFDVLQPGWVEILSTTPDLVSFTLAGDYGLNFLDGVNLSSPRSRKLLFPEITGQAQLFLVNPGSEKINVLLCWVQEDGELRQTVSLPAKGMLTGTPGSIFSEAAEGAAGGYVTAEVDADTLEPQPRPIFGVELFGDSERLGGLLALDYDTAGAHLFSAHLASDDSIETILNMINAGGVTDVTFEAVDESGRVVGSFRLENFSEGAQFRKSVREIFAFSQSRVVGWVRVSSEGRLLGSVSFQGTGGRFLASLPLAAKGAREFVLSHIAQGPSIFTGVALMNPGREVALVSVEAFNRDGQSLGSASLELATGEKIALLIPELIPGLVSQEGGFVWVRSNLPVVGFALFGNNSLDFLSAVPQQIVVE